MAINMQRGFEPDGKKGLGLRFRFRVLIIVQRDFEPDVTKGLGFKV